ncbi:hypothetical protein FRC12_018241, partial [Ceratobasidium sp. 428]
SPGREQQPPGQTQPQIIRVGSRASVSAPGPQVIRVTSPRPEYPPISVVHPPPSEPPQVVRVGTGRPESPQVIRVTSPKPEPTVVAPDVKPEPLQVVRVGGGTRPSTPQVIRVTSPRQDTVLPTPSVSTPTPVVPAPVSVIAAEPPQIVRVGTSGPQEGPQVIRVTSPRVEAPPPVPQPGPQVIRVTVPPQAPLISTAPSIVPVPPAEPTIIRVGSTAPVEPQVIRVTSPQPQHAPVVVAPAPAPAPVVVAPAPVPVPAPAPAQPVTEAPQIIRLPSRVEERPQVIRVGSAAPQPPQIIRVGSAAPQPPQIIRLGSTAPSEPQIVRVSSRPTQIIRVTSPSTVTDSSRIQITRPSEQPTPILQVPGAPSNGGRVVFQPTPSQSVISPAPTRISQPTQPPFSPQVQEDGTVISVIQPSDSISHVGGRDDDATPVIVIPGGSHVRSSHSGRSQVSTVPPSGPIILAPSAPSRVSSIRSIPSVVHAPITVPGNRSSVIELERQAAEVERQRTFERNEEARRRQAEEAERAEIARQERFEASERERQRLFDELEEERAQFAEDRRQQVFEIAESIRREVAEHGRADRSARDEGIGREIAQAVRDALDSSNAEREAFMRTIDEERLAAEDERARLLEMREVERVQELEDHRARMRGLEEELAAAREMIEQERLDRAAAEQARFDQFRAEAEEREAINRAQLADITNALEERRAEAASWREADDMRWGEKQQRRAAKAERADTLHDLVNGIIAEREEERRRQEEERVTAAARPGIEAVLAAMQQQNAETAAMMASIADTLRTDMDRKHLETLESVRATAAEQVPFNVQRYLDDFSKALSEEVRMLLKEVGKLREEKRALQHEIGCLLCLKSKYGPGGEFEPDWVPPGGTTCPTQVPVTAMPMSMPMPVPEPEPEFVEEEPAPAPKPSAWRTVRTRKKSQRDREEAM